MKISALVNPCSAAAQAALVHEAAGAAASPIAVLARGSGARPAVAPVALAAALRRHPDCVGEPRRRGAVLLRRTLALLEGT